MNPNEREDDIMSFGDEFTLESLLEEINYWKLDKGVEDDSKVYFKVWESWVDVIGIRPETDKERERRLVLEKRAKEQAKKRRELAEDKERAVYEKLKKKYGE